MYITYIYMYINHKIIIFIIIIIIIIHNVIKNYI